MTEITVNSSQKQSIVIVNGSQQGNQTFLRSKQVVFLSLPIPNIVTQPFAGDEDNLDVSTAR